MNTSQSAESSVGLTWFKSSYSGTNGGDCVEVAISPGTVHLRDSKNEPGPRLTLARTAWEDFISFATSTSRLPV
ncbi:DUF397 domain-containing protein [Streptomyces sp. TS71-3]|uniref:DUF397 domain-containing protein n=1 Tax=Streptomyces sp. TS71-3 TaxID=2733862 RepID=UPI001BB3F099|nr:DUF397 domain-containing protein [Streptomyces sp. TS71-3]